MIENQKKKTLLNGFQIYLLMLDWTEVQKYYLFTKLNTTFVKKQSYNKVLSGQSAVHYLDTNVRVIRLQLSGK